MNSLKGFQYEPLHSTSSSLKDSRYVGISLLKSLPKSLLIDDIYISRDHYALLFDDRRKLLVFDSVPSTKYIDDYQIEKLREAVLSHEVTSSHEIVLHKFDTPLIKVQILNGVLLALEQSGTLTLWGWNKQEWRWEGNISVNLIIGEEAKVTLSQCVSDFKFFWVETSNDSSYSLCYAEFDIKVLPVLDIRRKEFPPAITLTANVLTKALITSFNETPILMAPAPRSEGIWLFIDNTVRHYSVFETWDEIHMNTSALYCIHPITGEIVFLTDSGDVHVITIKKNQGSIMKSFLSSLHKFGDLQGEPLMYTVQHNLIIVSGERSYVFDLISGRQIGDVNNPTESPMVMKPLSEGDFPGGIWSHLEFWRIRMISQSSIDQILLHEEEIKCEMLKSIRIRYKDFNLTKWESKYLLELLTKLAIFDDEKTDDNLEGIEDMVKAFEILATNIQNPLILVPLIYSARIPRRYINDIFFKFLENLKEAKNDIKQNQYEQSLRWFTSLNNSLEAKAIEFLGIANDHHEPTKVLYNIEKDIDVIKHQNFDSISFGDLMTFIYYYPHKMLNLLQEYLKIPTSLLEYLSNEYEHDNTKDTVYGKAKLDPNVLDHKIYYNQQNQYFEIVALLYYQISPKLLLPFVDIVELSYQNLVSKRELPYTKDMTSFYSRASSVLPPLKAKDNTDQVNGRIMLLDRAGKTPLALKQLLHIEGYWNRAVNLVSSRKSETPLYYELYSTILNYAFISGDSEKLTTIVKFIPAKVSPLDIVSTIRSILHSMPKEKQTQDIFCPRDDGINVKIIKELVCQLSQFSA